MESIVVFLFLVTVRQLFYCLETRIMVNAKIRGIVRNKEIGFLRGKLSEARRKNGIRFKANLDQTDEQKIFRFFQKHDCLCHRIGNSYEFFIKPMK